jgi:hypothetical protein
MHRFFRCPLRRYFLSGPFPSITPHTLIDNQTFQIHDLGPTALSVSSLLTSLLPFHTTSTLQPPRRIRFPFSFPFFLRSVLTGPTYYLPYALCSLIVHVHSSSLASWATRIFYLFPFILLQHDSSFAQFMQSSTLSLLLITNRAAPLSSVSGFGKDVTPVSREARL